MFDFVCPSHRPLAAFLREHSEALQNASLLLGGQPRLRETESLIEEICEAPRITRRLQTALLRLHELLTLQHVHDPNQSEAGFFAMIDPEWSVVEDICALSDDLGHALEFLAAETAWSMSPAASD